MPSARRTVPGGRCASWRSDVTDGTHPVSDDGAAGPLQQHAELGGGRGGERLPAGVQPLTVAAAHRRRRRRRRRLSLAEQQAAAAWLAAAAAAGCRHRGVGRDGVQGGTLPAAAGGRRRAVGEAAGTARPRLVCAQKTGSVAEKPSNSNAHPTGVIWSL